MNRILNAKTLFESVPLEKTVTNFYEALRKKRNRSSPVATAKKLWKQLRLSKSNGKLGKAEKFYIYLSFVAGNGQHRFEMACVFYCFQKQNNNLFVMHLKNHGIEKPPHFSQKDFSTLKNKVHSPQK